MCITPFRLVSIPEEFQRVMGYIQSGKQEGAILHTGGVQIGNDGHLIHPTIFTDVKPGTRIAREEIFGPVVVVTKFRDEAGQDSRSNYRQGLA
jgi:aldehyde dehydrogenase (NAD+)